MNYVETDGDYFERRGLKRHARVWSLWALGVGAVISGQFSGWNLGIASGGFRDAEAVLYGPGDEHRRIGTPQVVA